MIQETIALIIVFSAFIYTIVAIANIFNKKKEDACNCGSCDLKSEVHKIKSYKKI